MQIDQAREVAEIFHLLGDPTRLRIVVACLNTPSNVGEIAAAVDASQSLVSHHLRLLRATRLLKSERRGRHMYYAPLDDHVRCIINDMIEHVGEPDSEEV
ncbi:MAG: helix-turn-helix transcriptional regulator [Rhodospirillales bacterium]|nr:helix-turn-helix transcriptional regulator [Rhodospirillales bacterium]